MFRLRHLWLLSVLIPLTACGAGAERLIGQFMSATRDGDDATALALSSVGFPGVIESWEILEAGEESTGPFRLAELQAGLVEAKRNLDFHQQTIANFLTDNKRVYLEYQGWTADESEKELPGTLVEFQNEYDQLLAEEKRLKEAFEQAGSEVERERSAAVISLMGSSVDDSLEGEVAEQEVLANVTTEEGGEKTYVFSLRRYDLVNKAANMRSRSRWIIADIQERGE